MFNPLDLLERITNAHKSNYKSQDTISNNYLKDINSMKFNGDSVQNSSADYFRKTHSQMFVENVSIFNKK